MDLEEIQEIWSRMSDQLERQKKLTNEIIIQMTQERYSNVLQKISTYETIGAVVCFAMAIILLINIYKLDTWYLLLCGLFTLFCLLVLPVLVLRSISAMKKINIAENNYKETMIAFIKARKQFLFIQRMSIYLGFILIISSLAVSAKIMNGKDYFLDNNAWLWSIPLMTVFLILFARWGYKYYKSATTSAENILRELE